MTPVDLDQPVLDLAPLTALSGNVYLPGSKSISNRALLLAALASGETRIQNLLTSEDTNRMLAALRQLEIQLAEDDGDVVVTGRGGPLTGRSFKTSSGERAGGAVGESAREAVHLDLGLAGTALRPLAAALTLGEGRFVLDGTSRMRERPVAHLVDGLRQLGATIDYLGQPGYPPIEVTGTGLQGGQITMQGNVSSQFLTSLLLSAPLASGDVIVNIEGEQVSKPYLDITLHMMQRFGVDVRHDDYRRFEVRQGAYQSPDRYLVEGDASSASYFLAAGAIGGTGVTVHGIGASSVQGDVAFVDVLETMGAHVHKGPDFIRVSPGYLRGVDLDLNHIPDAAMTVAVLALFADGVTTIRNIYNWRVKETDRLDAMSRELRKFGALVEEHQDSLTISPPARLAPATVDTYGDHRMAMCFALTSLAGIPVRINNPGCVRKTFPDFFEVFLSLHD